MKLSVQILRLMSLVSAALIWTTAFADRGSYAARFQYLMETSSLIVIHEHDWSKRYKAHREHWDVFGPQNTFSFLRIIDKASKRQIARVRVPPLRHVWVSPDARYIVGLSTVKVWNPIQVVVFSTRGERLFAQAVDRDTFGGVSGSVTNWVFWYKEVEPPTLPTLAGPNITMKREGSALRLEIEGNRGSTRAFIIKTPQTSDTRLPTTRSSRP